LSRPSSSVLETKDGKQRIERDVVLSSVVRVIRITAKDGKQRDAVLFATACVIQVVAKDGKSKHKNLLRNF
jgi:hypothetical protein